MGFNKRINCDVYGNHQIDFFQCPYIYDNHKRIFVDKHGKTIKDVSLAVPDEWYDDYNTHFEITKSVNALNELSNWYDDQINALLIT